MLEGGILWLTVGLTVGLVALLMGGMAIGVIVSDRRLAGSCGGTGADCLCEKRERGECPHDQPALPEGEPRGKLVAPTRLTQAVDARS